MRQLITSSKKAATLGFKPYFPYKIPYTDLYSEINESLDKQFSEYLEESTRVTGSLHVTLFQNPVSSPWYHNKPLNRKNIILINKIRSNHYNLNYSLFRKNKFCSLSMR